MKKSLGVLFVALCLAAGALPSALAAQAAPRCRS